MEKLENKKLNIEDLKKDLYLGDFGKDFWDYDSGYICDIITQIADSNVDIYTTHLLNWLVENYSIVEEANQELGVPEDGSIITQVQQGQYYAYEQDIYENLEDILKWFAYKYIQDVLEINEITEEQNEELLESFDFSDNNEELENLISTIQEIFEKED